MGRRHSAGHCLVVGTDANICVPVKQGIITFRMSEGLVTTTSPGGQFEGTLNDFKFQVNKTCPAS